MTLPYGECRKDAVILIQKDDLIGFASIATHKAASGDLHLVPAAVQHKGKDRARAMLVFGSPLPPFPLVGGMTVQAISPT